VNRYALPLLALLASSAVAPEPAAARFRAPQAPVAGGGLQAFFDGVGESIDVSKDQLVYQRWRSADPDEAEHGSTIRVQIELVRRGSGNAIGVYDASGSGATALHEIFPAEGGGGDRAISTFESREPRLTVTVFDRRGAWHSQRSYLGSVGSRFGYYISGAGGVGFSQDSRQSPARDARVLAFAGTGMNQGRFWICFEDNDPGDPDPDADFDDAILLVGPVDPTPAVRSAWGSVKALFR